MRGGRERAGMVESRGCGEKMERDGDVGAELGDAGGGNAGVGK